MLAVLSDSILKWSQTLGIMPSTATMAIGEIVDPDLVALHAYWTTKCSARAVPRRADINPKDITALLPHIMILEIHEPLRFSFRLVGTKICERWGEDHTGKWLDELDFDGSRAAVLAQYASVVGPGVPQFNIDEFVNDGGRYLHYRRLLLPLSEDGITTNMLLGIQKAIGIEGYHRALPRWM